MMNSNEHILIIGGGIIGVSAAYYFAQQGMKVTLVDKGEICDGSSYGNAGFLCPGHSIPTPAPGVLSQGLKWLLNPESPFYIRPRLDPGLISWLWRFQAHSNMRAVRRAIPLLRDMQRASLKLFRELIKQEHLTCNFQQEGGLSVYRTERGFAAGQEDAEELQKFGLDITALDGDAVRELEPIIGDNIVGGIHYREDAHLEPALFVNGLMAAAQVLGADAVTMSEVLEFETTKSRITTVHTTRGVLKPSHVIIAAGAWSLNLAKKLGINFPLQPAKGYSITLDQPAVKPKLHIFLSEAKVAVTPIGSRLRLAGTLELTGLDLTINQRRVNAILQAGERYLRNVNTGDAGEVWSGLRPCSPDGLPYIGRSQKLENLIFATGHGMLGVSMGPITGKLVKQIVCEEIPDIPVDAFALDRFN